MAVNMHSLMCSFSICYLHNFIIEGAILFVTHITDSSLIACCTGWCIVPCPHLCVEKEGHVRMAVESIHV